METPLLAPPRAMGWTHIWDGDQTQLAISDEVAAALVYLGIIEYSGIYRVYRPRHDWCCNLIEAKVLA